MVALTANEKEGIMRKKSCVLVLIMLLCCVLVACNDVPDDKGVRMERDLSVDTSSPIGLYFYASDGTYQRYNENLGENYFDTNKPTVAFFHGWLPEASGFKDGEICHNADEFAPKIIEAGYNFCALDYSKFAQSLPALFNYIWMGFDDSHSVACRFAREFAACFKDYDKEIRFVSHSYGAHSSTATAYLLSKMVEQGIIGANCLPSRMTYADPYLGDLFTGGMFGGIKGDTIENVGESIGARSTTEVVADCMQYLSDKGVVIDVYCGMPMAYDQFLEKETERRDACKKKLYDSGAWTILKGLQKKYGTVGDIHMLTLEWTFDSFFADVKHSERQYFPTASLDNQKMLALKGKLFESTLEELNVNNDVLVEVQR